MAIISRQRQIFEWAELEILGDLERLRLVLQYIPDEKLMQHVERERFRGRDDYPVRAVWNSILAGVVYQHPTVESLRRELSRNSQLRNICGFDADKVPTSAVYSRFLAKLFSHQELLDEIFESLVGQCYELLPGFGQQLALDGKAINSHAKSKSKSLKKDGRRDLDADYGVKKYKGEREDGSLWEKVVSWFGYKLHLVVDADYELPVAFSVAPASHAEIKEAHLLIDSLSEKRSQVLKTAQYLIADRGYDDTKLILKMWDESSIKPVIDLRNAWRDGEETKPLKGFDNIVYDYRGTVYCCCPQERPLNTAARPNIMGLGVKAKKNVRLNKASASHLPWIKGSLPHWPGPATNGKIYTKNALL